MDLKESFGSSSHMMKAQSCWVESTKDYESERPHYAMLLNS